MPALAESAPFPSIYEPTMSRNDRRIMIVKKGRWLRSSSELDVRSVVTAPHRSYVAMFGNSSNIERLLIASRAADASLRPLASFVLTFA